MDKRFEETTVGKLINRFADTGEMGTMNHTVSNGTVLKIGIAIVVAGLALFAIKKILFK